MPKTKEGLTSPKAKALTALNDSWYRVKASSTASAEIWLYDEIGGWGISAREFADDIKALGEVKHIDLRIHSPGGDVFEGMAIYNLLKNHPAKITVHIDGLAASIGSVIAMAGDTIIMPENAMMMIHKPWGMQGGDADDMRKYAELLDKVEDTLVSAYTRSGKPADEIKQLLKAETWYTGAEAVAAGFADKVTTSLEAVAKLKSQREYNNMPKHVKAFFEPKNSSTGGGAPQPAPAAPAPQPAPQNAPQPQPAPARQAPVQPDESAIKAQLLAAENQRRESIKAIFVGFDSQSQLMSECMLDMSCTAEQAKDKLLAKLGSGATPTAAIHAGNGNLIGDSVKNSILSRAGLDEHQSDNAFAGCTLGELARASLVERGVSVSGMDRKTVVGLAFTHSTSDFGNILQDVAHKSMLKGHEEAGEVFQQFTSTGVLTDFRASKRVDLTTFPNLDKVGEGSEYKYGKVGDRGEEIILATYGKLFSITRQAIINDDLSALTRVPRLMGRAAIRTVADLVFAVLTGNPKMSDGKALFHADHGNLATGADMSVAAISAAMTKMRTQKDGEAVLNIMPKFLLTSVANEATALALLAAEFDPALADARVPNPIRSRLEVISDARLDAAGAAGASFMLADGNVTDTIEVAYLDGNDKPYLEQQDGFTVDGAAFKVRIDAGVAPLSWRTMVKMPPK